MLYRNAQVVCVVCVLQLALALDGYAGDAPQTQGQQAQQQPVDAPQVEVTNVRRVFHNGEHNAFTDLVEFHGRYYLAFRTCPDGHMVHPTSRIIVLASDDLADWQKVHEFGVPKRDTRSALPRLQRSAVCLHGHLVQRRHDAAV
ncbi:MAG: hypothetical protein R3C10_24115 [Pirellulales bacterium]